MRKTSYEVCIGHHMRYMMFVLYTRFCHAVNAAVLPSHALELWFLTGCNRALLISMQNNKRLFSLPRLRLWRDTSSTYYTCLCIYTAQQLDPTIRNSIWLQLQKGSLHDNGVKQTRVYIARELVARHRRYLPSDISYKLQSHYVHTKCSLWTNACSPIYVVVFVVLCTHMDYKR